MAEYPALPLFTDAYLADTRHLTTAQHGAYMLMLMTAWRAPDCSLPDDDVFLARICGMDKRTWASNKIVLLAFWQRTSDAKLFQKRLKDERNYVEGKRNKNVAAGNASALKRKNRHSTGVTTKPQPKTNQPTPTPIVVSSGDKSPSDTPIPPKSKTSPPLPDWLDREAWEGFKTMRAGIKKPLKPHGEKIAISKLEEFRAMGHDPTKILNYSTMNDYPGLYEPKEKHNGNSNGSNGKGDGNTSNQGSSGGQKKSSWQSEAERIMEKRWGKNQSNPGGGSGDFESNNQPVRAPETIREDIGGTGSVIERIPVVTG